MQLNRQQKEIIGAIVAIPGAVELIRATLTQGLAQRFHEDIEADPTIDDPEPIYEILSKGSGHMEALIKQAIAAAAS